MKKTAPLFTLALVAVLAGCSSSSDSSSSSSSSSSSGSAQSDCTFVTEADLLSVASISASKIPRDPTKGAGSVCNGNFAVVDASGKPDMVLMIDFLSSRDEFDHPSALLTQTYPTQETPTDLGAEAKLFLGADADGGAKVLWLWKGNTGYQLVTFYKIASKATPQLTKAQLLALGKIAATR
jgi:hypothetical protein